nr:beta-amyrin synthase 1 [Quercus suber]
MLCCWVDDPDGDYFKKHLARLKEYIWVAEDGIKMQSFGSQSWDASLAIQALITSDLTNEIGPVLARGHDFLKKSQVRDNPPGDSKRMYRHISKGSWTFSDQDNGLQVSDCTAECLRMLNPVEFYADIIIEHEYVECTASAIQALVLFKKLYPEHRKKEIEDFITNAVRYIENMQMLDGSWYGNWGICFLYGTWFALGGLAAAGKTYYNCPAMRKAVDFLLKTQKAGSDPLTLGTELDSQEGMVCMISFPSPTWLIDLKASYATDQQVQSIIKALGSGQVVPKDYSLQNGLLLYKGKVYLGTCGALKTAILHQLALVVITDCIGWLELVTSVPSIS